MSSPRVTLGAGVALGLVLLLVGHVGAAREPRIANGVSTTDRPATGALLLGTPALQICTGTLVGCNTFLIAAHCVCDENGSTCNPDESVHEVFFQHAGRFPVAQITPHPDFIDFPSAENDLALVTLDAPVTGIAPIPLASTPPPFGTEGTLVGFGNVDDSNLTSGLKYEGRVVTTSCAFSGASDSQYVCWDPEPPPGPPGTDSNACAGDSGGPLFVQEGATTVVAGAVSFGLGLCAGDDFSGAANVANYASWIASVAGSDLGGGACGAVAPIGDPETTVQGFEDSLPGAGTGLLHPFQVDPGAGELRITLNAREDGIADFDLTMRFGTPPSPGLNDCESRTESQFETCLFSSPTPGTWYAQSESFAGSGPYQITVTELGPAGATCGNGLLEAGETCDDGNTLPGDGCDAACQIEATAGTCAAAPQAGCDALALGSSSLQLKGGKRPGKDKLRWSWKPKKTGVQPFVGSFLATDARLCLYDGTGGLLFETGAEGPGWTENRKGYRFTGAGAPGTLDSLRIGTRGRITLKAKGREIPMLPLPAGDVIAQLSNDGGGCWEALYDAPPRKNDERRFSDRIKLR